MLFNDESYNLSNLNFGRMPSYIQNENKHHFYMIFSFECLKQLIGKIIFIQEVNLFTN